MRNDSYYDVIAIGSGFASSFFIYRYLQSAAPNVRVLILERGAEGQEQKMQTANSGSFSSKNHEKQWLFTLGLGGGSNCWWACTPRFLPNDFNSFSLYGVGVDWPFSYAELEPYYSQAEIIMSVSGPDYNGLYPRSRPYPQPPHKFSSIDEVFKQAYPDSFFQQPTARARAATRTRPKCCASGICHRCPINAKFMINNDLAELFKDPRVEVRIGCEVDEIIHSGSIATGVRYLTSELEGHQVNADLIVLGANGIFNPFLLMKSGLKHKKLGRGITDQISQYVYVDLDGLEGYDGSTSVTGHGYMLYDGEHRKKHAPCLMETSNVLQSLRLERGKYRQRVNLKFIFEDLSKTENYVRIDPLNENIPEVVYTGYSDYTQRGIDNMKVVLPELLSALPVESIHHQGDKNKTEAHIHSTTLMGREPAQSIVDENQVHHKVRNLIVVGSSVFPTAPPANPTLTLSALSLRAADKLVARSAL